MGKLPSLYDTTEVGKIYVGKKFDKVLFEGDFEFKPSHIIQESLQYR